MNVHDSDRMEEVLRQHGWSKTHSLAQADLVLFNTCSVREKAEQKLRSEVGKLGLIKQERPGVLVAVAGCVAQQEGERLLKDIPQIDVVIGPDNILELPALLQQQMGGSPPMARTIFDTNHPFFLQAQPEPGYAPVSAFVTTMKGCDERCSFCIVPYTRGPERYRPARDIVQEIQRFVAAGTKEITLLGQTVDSYKDPSLPPVHSEDPDESQFPALLRLIAKEVPGLVRLRYTSPHPRHATASLAQAHAELDVLAKHVHLPAQSGSNRMLKRMIRRYTKEEYISRVKRLQAARPGLTLSTDIIVGFSGETEEDFQETLSLVQEVGFVSLYGFQYSVRPHTPARKLPDDVPAAVKKERLARLLALIETQGPKHLESLVGSTQTVLVEGRSKMDDKANNQAIPRFQGRTEQNEIVHIEAPLGHTLTGQVVKTRIVSAHKFSLRGELLPESLPLAIPIDPVPPNPVRKSLPLFAGQAC